MRKNKELPALGHNWPFPSVNGVQTEASKVLQDAPIPPAKSLYETVMLDPDTEEALL